MNVISSIPDSSERYARCIQTSKRVLQPNTMEGIMKCIDEKSECHCPEQEFTEEQFFEQFAALEEGLALLQIQMRSLSEHAKRFGSIAGQMRRSICPATRSSK